MVTESQAKGFTLIEVILALAIASGLLLIVFAGQSQLRARARFSDAVERAKTITMKAKNEAFTTVSTETGATYSNTFFAKVVYFEAGSSTVTVYTLKFDGNNVLLAPTIDYTADLPYGVKDVDTQNTCLAFAKSTDSAKTIGYTVPDCKLADLTNLSKYGSASQTVKVDDGAGLTADINFDPQTLSVAVVYP